MSVSANRYTANSLYGSSDLLAIVVGHPMGAVKEQSANLYAQKLAEHVFVTVSIVLSFWDGSEGEPGKAILPDVYADTFSAAVDYLRTQDFVNREPIDGEYSLHTQQQDSR